MEPKKKRKAQNKILDEWYVYRPSSKVVGLQECHQYWSLVKLQMKDKNMQFQEEISIATNTIDYREPVWYVCLKTKNCCLKTFVKIRVGEKVY